MGAKAKIRFLGGELLKLHSVRCISSHNFSQFQIFIVVSCFFFICASGTKIGIVEVSTWLALHISPSAQYIMIQNMIYIP